MAILLTMRLASCGLYPNATSADAASASASNSAACAAVGSVISLLLLNRSPLSPLKRSFISTTRRSAVFLPTPGNFTNEVISSRSTALTNCCADMPDKMASASFGPTPLTLINSRNSARSCLSLKPYSSCASSRTTNWVNTIASCPSSGSS
ncbi:hypothetical protein D3C81_1801790 [compost metagenome]